jgi:hypothetical protein
VVEQEKTPIAEIIKELQGFKFGFRDNFRKDIFKAQSDSYALWAVQNAVEGVHLDDF